MGKTLLFPTIKLSNSFREYFHVPIFYLALVVLYFDLVGIVEEPLILDQNLFLQVICRSCFHYLYHLFTLPSSFGFFIMYAVIALN